MPKHMSSHSTPRVEVIRHEHHVYLTPLPPEQLQALMSFLQTLTTSPAGPATPPADDHIEHTPQSLAGDILHLPASFFAQAAQQGAMPACAFIELAAQHGLPLARTTATSLGVANSLARHPDLTTVIHDRYRIMRCVKFSDQARSIRCTHVVDLHAEPDARQRELIPRVAGYRTVTTRDWLNALESMPISAFEALARRGETMTSKQLLTALSAAGHIDMETATVTNAHKALIDLLATSTLMINGQAVTFTVNGKRCGVHVAPALTPAA